MPTVVDSRKFEHEEDTPTKKNGGADRNSFCPTQVLRHDFEERGLESLHLFFGAYRDANVGRPYGPDTSDVNVVLLGHRLHHFASGALHIHHEFVALRWNEREVVLVEKRESIFADVAD